jgi:hypothetical protein
MNFSFTSRDVLGDRKEYTCRNCSYVSCSFILRLNVDALARAGGCSPPAAGGAGVEGAAGVGDFFITFSTHSITMARQQLNSGWLYSTVLSTNPVSELAITSNRFFSFVISDLLNTNFPFLASSSIAFLEGGGAFTSALGSAGVAGAASFFENKFPKRPMPGRGGWGGRGRVGAG